jgi:hypothetical protein
MQTNDFAIRSVLQNQLLEKYRHNADAMVLSELGICQGLARIDMAVVNGSLNGYEIKSDLDTLDRLPMQSMYYCKVFDCMEIIIGERHLQEVLEVTPSWWGITIATKNDIGVQLEVYRKGLRNEEPDAYAIAQLLWKSEALNLLCEYDLEKGCKSKNKEILWRRLADNLPLNDLKRFVRQCLKARTNWRVDLEPNVCDG